MRARQLIQNKNFTDPGIVATGFTVQECDARNDTMKYICRAQNNYINYKHISVFVVMVPVFCKPKYTTHEN